MESPQVIIIGAGPAGLTAGYELMKRSVKPLILEKDDMVGGLARTVQYKGYGFDLGGHRFFSKFESINRLWQEMLGEDYLKVTRKSRIYYMGRFFDYPLDFHNTFSSIGPFDSFLILMSYLRVQFRNHGKEDTFDQWIINRFGHRLYTMFFKTYTEKVWGIPCHKIRADWAAQRIKGLSLLTVLSNTLMGIKKPKSLIHEFHYPAEGAGMMWRRFQEEIEGGGGRIQFDAEAVRIKHENGIIRGVTTNTRNQKKQEFPVGHLISSMPVNLLVTLFEPQAPVEVIEAAEKLSFENESFDAVVSSLFFHHVPIDLKEQ